MDDFHSVSWQNEPDSEPPRPTSLPRNELDGGGNRPGVNGRRLSSTQQAGQDADAVDLGGIGEGRLDCTVDKPMKESDGTKDAYVSYLVTTNVGIPQWSRCPVMPANYFIDRLQILPET